MTAAVPEFIDLGAAAEGGAEGESMPSGTYDLGNGNKLFLSAEQFRALLHDPIVVAAITERAQGVCDDANRMKKKPNAQYIIRVQNQAASSRARAFVKPGNADAFYDDALHSTLLKAAANAPNDPKPYTSNGNDNTSSDDGGDESGDAGAADAGADAGAADAGAGAADAAADAAVAIIAL